MHTRITTALLAASSLAAFAEDPAAPAAEPEEEGNLPGLTLGADYCSRQITRGLPDNTEGIVTLEDFDRVFDLLEERAGNTGA